MAAHSFLLAYLLAVSITDEVNLTVAPVQRLANYQYNFNFSELIPGLAYNGSVSATWAIPPSALSGLEGRRITVRVSAEAANGSGISFPSAFGGSSNRTEAYLYCDVQNASCANTSVLSILIPLSLLLSQEGASPSLSLKSEIVEGTMAYAGPDAQKSASDLLEAFRKTFAGSGENGSANASGLFPGQEPNNSSDGNLLDRLKPEGDSSDPIDYLRANPVISLAALAIVVVITGAYLLNAKD